MAKTLVLYFSVYGTAKKTAEEIARQSGADLEEIVPVTSYDSNQDHYSTLARRAKAEHDRDERPGHKEPIDLSGYDTVFLGYPMWWYTFPMIIYTLLESYDFTGKTIIPSTRTWDPGTAAPTRPYRTLPPAPW